MSNPDTFALLVDAYVLHDSGRCGSDCPYCEELYRDPAGEPGGEDGA